MLRLSTIAALCLLAALPVACEDPTAPPDRAPDFVVRLEDRLVQEPNTGLLFVDVDS